MQQNSASTLESHSKSQKRQLKQHLKQHLKQTVGDRSSEIKPFGDLGNVLGKLKIQSRLVWSDSIADHPLTNLANNFIL